MKKYFSGIFLLIGILSNLNVSAQPELDTTFGGTGKFIVPIPAIGSAANIFFLPDNKIFQIGACEATNPSGSIFCTWHLNDDGSLDTSYGTPNNPGFLVTQIPGLNTNVERGIAGAVMQSDGKIVAAGFGTVSDQSQTILIRLNPNGSLDATFGTNGIVTIPILGGSRASGIAIQPDGKTLVAGFAGSTSAYQHYVARFNTDGTIDNSFGTNGVAFVIISGNFTSGLSVAVQADGKIVTSGGTVPISGGGQASLLIARLNKNGALDTTFDQDGYKTIDYGTSDIYTDGLRSVRIQSDGRILALSHLNILYRFNSDGSLDTSFDDDGSRPALDSPLLTTTYSVSASGKITVVGYPPNTPINYRIARYQPNGLLDPGFSGDGLLEIDIDNSRNDVPMAVDLDLQGRTFISGFSGTFSFQNPKFSNARLTAAPVQNVGFSGRVTDSDGKPVINAFVTLTKGAETIGNGRTNPFGYFNFKNIPTNQTYKLSTRAKNLNFTDQSVLIDDTITNFLVVGGQ